MKPRSGLSWGSGLAGLARVAGLATVLAALVWWGLTYGQVWANHYLTIGEAGRCLVAESSICSLAATLCSTQHLIRVAGYSPMALWLGVTVLCLGAVTRARV